jgi:hypothetical protein
VATVVPRNFYSETQASAQSLFLLHVSRMTLSGLLKIGSSHSITNRLYLTSASSSPPSLFARSANLLQYLTHSLFHDCDLCDA